MAPALPEGGKGCAILEFVPRVKSEGGNAQSLQILGSRFTASFLPHELQG